jgi:hypothetical protein
LTPLWDNDDFLFPCVHSFYLRKIETIDTISSNFYTPKNAVTKFPCTKYSPPLPQSKIESNEIQHKKIKGAAIYSFFPHTQRKMVHNFKTLKNT